MGGESPAGSLDYILEKTNSRRLQSNLFRNRIQPVGRVEHCVPWYVLSAQQTWRTLKRVLGSTEYEKNMEHWAKTNEQLSACIVEPGTAADLGRVVRIGQLSHV